MQPSAPPFVPAPRPEIASLADYAECRRVMFGASKNYAFASRLLSPGILRHVEAVYALMRVGDNRVDISHRGFGSAIAAIEDWEALYWDGFNTWRSDHPVIRAYLQTARDCGIPAEVMRSYFRAMRDDLTVTRFATFADLLYYMQGSAIPVGRAMTYILGVRAPCSVEDTLPHADSLAIAMQLSNFWRDVGEDWRRGRVYLPQDEMAAFGVSESDLAACAVTPSFVALLESLMARTEAYYVHARAGVRRLATGRLGVMAGLEIYRAIHEGIRRNGYDVFRRRAGTSKPQKIGLVLKAAPLVYLARPN